MIPAIPFILIVKQYAHARGLNFRTWSDMKIAIDLYTAHAIINN